MGKGDSVAIMLGNRPEFHVADLAAMTLGATPFSIYRRTRPSRSQYVVSDAGARVAIIERRSWTASLEARKEPARPRARDARRRRRAADGTSPLADVEGADPDFDAEPPARAVEPEDVLTLIYTSGTTGPPKGVQITHRNLMAAVAAVEELIEFPEGAARDLVAAGRAHRRARRAPLHPDRASASRSRRARTRARSSATCPRCARTGSSPCRASGRSSRPAWRRWSPASPRSSASSRAGALDAAIEKVRLEQARRGRSRTSWPRPWPRPTSEMFAGLREMLGLDEVVAVNVGAAPTPRRGARVLPRDRHAGRRAVGDVRDVRRGHRQPARAGSRSAPSARRRRGSRSSSPRTARC